MRFSALVLGFALGSAGTAWSLEGPAGAWTGSAGLGASITTGNAETTNFNAEFKSAYQQIVWEQEVLIRGIASSDNDETTAERYVGNYKLNYKRSEHRYLFGALRGEYDRFGGFDYLVSQTAGFGFRVLRTPGATLDLEGGLGLRQSKRTDGELDNEMVLRGGLGYEQRLSETAQFNQDLLVVSGETNTQIESVTALKLKVIAKLALQVSLIAKHNTQVPAGVEETDTISALTLVYDF